MTVYTVHMQNEDAQEASFVPDGFSWRAFVFAPLWLLRHGLWLATLLWCAAMIIIFAAPLGLSLLAKELCALLIALLCGLEGQEWRRQKLSREGKGLSDIVTGDSQDDAEVSFFHRFAASNPTLSIVPSRSAAAWQTSAVEAPFGLFPEPEKRP